MKYLRDNASIKAFGNHLKTLRQKKNISQEKLAYDCGMEISQISRIERGVINTSISNLFLIAKSLNVHPKELLDFEVPN